MGKNGVKLKIFNVLEISETRATFWSRIERVVIYEGSSVLSL